MLAVASLAPAAAAAETGAAGTGPDLLATLLAAAIGGGAALAALGVARNGALFRGADGGERTARRPSAASGTGRSGRPPAPAEADTALSVDATAVADGARDAALFLERRLRERDVGGIVFAPADRAGPGVEPAGAVVPRAFGALPEDMAARIAAAVRADAEHVRAEDALALAVRRLVEEGIPFELDLRDDTGRHLRLSGALDGLRPFVVAEPRRGRAAARGDEAADAVLVDLLPHPVWRRLPDGRVLWANAAFREAIGAGGEAGETTIDALLGQEARARLAAAAQADGEREGDRTPAAVRVTTVAGGHRRTLDVIERVAGGPADAPIVGVAIDVTELDEAHRRLSRTVAEQAATFDRLATAVAIFGPDRKLRFHNAAYRSLWQLDEAFLDDAPADETVLDRLRADRRLPETADFRAFKKQALAGYQSVESFEQWWHLPDGRTLRVVANPNPEGGVTYIYENLTEQLALEARFNALTRTQAETIDNLKEGVATFGPDGLVQLSNPAFGRLWNVPDGRELVGRHVTEIAAEIAATDEEKAAWGRLAATVTGLAEQRASLSGRVDGAGGRTLDYASVPLPDGSTLVTFVDVTDTVRVARALAERNQALEEADRLKNAFIEHISYELRSPLTSIIGFTQMLVGGTAGALSERQREYAGYISRSSQALLAIIDDVLDLATIDAGIMALEIAEVDVTATLAAAAEALQDRIREAGLALEIDVADDARLFEADEKRLRQILFNVLSNAVAHSAAGATIRVRARATAMPDGTEAVAVAIRDEGVGIPEEKVATVFERFEADASRGRHRGVGLGLSLVKSFTELHGGRVELVSTEGVGTEVTVTLPRRAGPRTDGGAGGAQPDGAALPAPAAGAETAAAGPAEEAMR